MFCRECKTLFKSKPKFLLHKAAGVCSKDVNIYKPLQSNEEDSDPDDPSWEPENDNCSQKAHQGFAKTTPDSPVTKEQEMVAADFEQILYDFEIQGFDETTPDSPVTKEQEMVAADFEQMLCDFEIQGFAETTPDSPVTKEQEMVAADCEQILYDFEIEGNVLSNEEKENTQVLSNEEKENTQNSLNIVYESKKEALKKKLLDVQNRIAIWKEKRKEASALGKKSSERRLNRKIKKLKVASKQLEEPCGVENLVKDDQAAFRPRQLFKDNNLEGDLIPHVTENHTVAGDVIEQEIVQDEYNKNEINGKGKCFRKKNYCLYCKKLVVKFSEHLEKVHKDSLEAKALKNIKGDSKSKRLLKTKITDPLRKSWNDIYNQQNPFVDKILVKKRHSGQKVASVNCLHCKGLYRKDKLSVHLKTCIVFKRMIIPDNNKKIEAIKKNSYVLTPHRKLISDEFYNEILKGIQLDNITEAALNDPAIMIFASKFHESRRGQEQYVIREMRDLSRLLLELRKLNPQIKDMADAFNPAFFDTLLAAALYMAGYEAKSGHVKVPSIAYRLLTPLKDCANDLKTYEIKMIYQNNLQDRTKITMIDDFLTYLDCEWKKRIGRICRKALKTGKADKIQIIADQSDIVKLASYIEGSYRKIIKSLDEDTEKKEIYDKLSHYLVVHIMLLVRRRPVDFKLAKVRHFGNIDRNDELYEMVQTDFTEEELQACKNFQIFYVPGKNFDIVPIVLTPLMRQVLDTLTKYRSKVNIVSDTLFVLSDDRPLKPVESLKILKKTVKLKNPDHMTGNGLRHQAATFSRLHSNHPQYQDFLASVLGHSLHIHKKNYQLPVSVIQKIMVCPILRNIMEGKKTGNNEISFPMENSIPKETLVEDPIFNQANQYEIREPVKSNLIHKRKISEVKVSNVEGKVKKTKLNTLDDIDEDFIPSSDTEQKSSDDESDLDLYDISRTPKKKSRWSQMEQNQVLFYFGEQILNKIPPTRKEVEIFLTGNPSLSKNRTLSQVYLFVRNHALRSQKNVTPKVRKVLQNVQNRNT